MKFLKSFFSFFSRSASETTALKFGKEEEGRCEQVVVEKVPGGEAGLQSGQAVRSELAGDVDARRERLRPRPVPAPAPAPFRLGFGSEELAAGHQLRSEARVPHAGLQL